MPDVSLESDVARVRSPHLPCGRGIVSCYLGGDEKSAWVGGWTMTSSLLYSVIMWDIYFVYSSVSGSFLGCGLCRRVFNPAVGYEFFPKKGVDDEAFIRRVV